MNTQKTNFTGRIYAWLLVLLPVLSQYKLGPLDLDVVVFAAFFLCAIIFRKRLYVVKVNRYIAGMIAYIAGVTVINILVGYKYSPVSDIILRAGRYCLYLFVVFFLGNECVSYESLMRVYRVIAYAATIYVILQTVVYYATGLTLPNKLGAQASDTMTTEVGRFRAFYSEPSVIGYSLTPFVACSLLKPGYRKNGKDGAIDALFTSAGIILSTSGQGILAIAIVWVLWLVIRIKDRKFKAKEIFLFLSIAVIAIVLYSVGILEYALDRVGNSNEGGAIDTRMSGYETLKLLSPLQLIFGAGFGNYVVENSFNLNVFYDFVNYSTIAEFLFTQGIVGTLLWFVFFIGVFRKGSACSKVLLIAMGALSLGGCPMTGLLFPIWLTLICVQLPEGQFCRPKKLEPEQS